MNLWHESPILVWLNSDLILTIRMECPPKLPCKLETKYLGAWPGPFSILAFHEKVAVILLGEILSSFLLPEVNLLPPWGPLIHRGSPKCLSLFHGWFIYTEMQ